MKGRIIWVGALVVALGALLVSQVKSQDDQSAQMPDMQEMMKKWQATMQPGPHHKALEPLAGSWKVTMKMYMGGPDSEPMETQGKSQKEWVLGGRFLQEKFSCPMMMPGADGQMQQQQLEGLGFTGYDNAKNLYVSTWADTMGTQLLWQSGGASPSGKKLTLYGRMDEPMLDVSDRMVKYVTTIEGPDKHVFEVFDLHAGDNYKVVEVVYERQK